MEVLQFWAAGQKRVELPNTIRSIMMAGITIGVAVAVLISMLHLGSPLRAGFALNNLGTSWLSREILLLILFGGGVAHATLMWRRGWGSETSRIVVGRISVVLGLVLVYVMARLYMLPTTPGWNTIATPISFFSTSLVLGGCAVFASLVYLKSASPPPDNALVIVVWALMILLGVEIVATPLQAGVLYDHPMLIDHGDRFTMLNTLLAVRVLSVVAAMGILIKFLSSSFQLPRRWTLTTIVLVLFAEVVGRYIFYAFYYRIGV
jgi:anaerobic dimethyl sulfoxide reductase subunit C (anchor subunit)